MNRTDRRRVAPRSLLALLVVLSIGVGAQAHGREAALDAEGAARFARLALDCVQKEYPNKLDHVMNDGGEVQAPGVLHPAFYGCYDWHSAVHGHWMLVRLLKTFPHLEAEDAIRAALDANLAAENILLEVEYLHQPSRQSFERTYGWAWLLKLAEELNGWDDPDGRRWAANLAPLAGAIVLRYLDFLPRQTYPIRTGVHPNTAFGLAFAWDYAVAVDDRQLRLVVEQRAHDYYTLDEDCPARWEPGGEDFFSPCLLEADLMRRVLPRDQYAAWLYLFLPGLREGRLGMLAEPATVSDRSDPKIVHLDGLNLSRAWCMFGIASALPSGTPARQALVDAGRRHLADALANVDSGHYEGTHWLASFAVFALGAREDLTAR